MSANSSEGRRNIIVIGASAGGLPALEVVLKGLSAEIDAAIFVVLHLAPHSNSVLPRLLNAYSDVPATRARDSELIERPHIYVAEPDHHLIVEPGRVRSIRGPKENWFRPSVDVLFRSAAYAFGPRVLGIVLSGMLDDGAAGLRAIKGRGGFTIVQEPADARFPMMPEAALRAVSVDARQPAAEIGRLLMEQSRKQAPSADQFPISKELEIEVRIAKQELDSAGLLAAVESLGKRTTMTCPECHGTLWELDEEGQVRYRCHVGHAYSDEALSAGQSTILEEALWSATRALEEKVMLTRRLSERLRSRGLEQGALNHAETAERLDTQAKVLRQLVLNTRGAPAELEEERVEQPG